MTKMETGSVTRPPRLGIAAPADAGIAVVRGDDGVLDLQIVEPRQARDEEVPQRVAVLGERPAVERERLLPLPLGDEVAVGALALDQAVDIHAVGLHERVRRAAPVVFHDAPVQNPPPQLRHTVGRARHRVQQAQKNGRPSSAARKSVISTAAVTPAKGSTICRK